LAETKTHCLIRLLRQKTRQLAILFSLILIHRFRSSFYYLEVQGWKILSKKGNGCHTRVTCTAKIRPIPWN